jgi:hypothetical protein
VKGIVSIDADELERLWQEANQAGLEGRVITAVQFRFDGACGAIDAFRTDWTPAPREHRHVKDCGCEMCR